MPDDRIAKLIFQFENQFPYRFQFLHTLLWTAWRFYDKWLKWMRIKTRIKHFYQRQTRGWDDSELWNLDVTIAKFILPRLKIFQERKDTFPAIVKIPDAKTWAEILDKIIWSFEFVLTNYGTQHECTDKEVRRQNMKQYEEGMSLFAKYYWCLWD